MQFEDKNVHPSLYNFRDFKKKITFQIKISFQHKSNYQKYLIILFYRPLSIVEKDDIILE